MKILVTFAVDSEMGTWRQSSRIARDIRFVRTGIGMRRPQNDLREAFAGSIDICIASGLAGSLKEEHTVGSVIVARGIKAEGKKTVIPCDGGLIDAAVRCGAKPVDFFYTSSTIANSNGDRERLGRVADAVDMESFHVLDEARGSGVPAIAIRAISDSPDQTLPIDFSRTVTPQGDIARTMMIRELILHPSRLPAFVRFGIGSSAAIRNLTDFLDRYVRLLSVNGIGSHVAAEQISR
jgi:Phosphorylase superfamily